MSSVTGNNLESPADEERSPWRRSPRGGRRVAALALLCVAEFVNVLGVTIVVVALPQMQRDLGSSGPGIEWILSVYALFFGGFLMVSGRAADLYGRRRLFTGGLVLFGSASLLCGFANSVSVLVTARAAQGLGAAGIIPAALSLLTTTFTESRERARALGIWTAAAAGGGAMGFVAGGALTEGLGWEWVFLVNVPVVALALLLTPFLLPPSRDPAASRSLDILGAVAITAGLLSFIYSLSQAKESGYGSATTIWTLLAAVAFLVTFCFIERRAEHPLIPPSVFRSRALVGACIVAFTLTAVTSPAGVLASIYLQNALGYSPRATGLALLPFSVSVIAGSSVGPWLTDRVGGKKTMTLGMSVMVAAIVILSRVPAEGGLGILVLGVSVAGLGLGCASVASTAVGTLASARHDQGIVSGLLNTAAQIGTAMGVALLITVAANRADALAHGAEPGTVDLIGGLRFAFLIGVGLGLLGGAVGLPLVGRHAGRPQE